MTTETDKDSDMECITCSGVGKLLVHDFLIVLCDHCNGSGKEHITNINKEKLNEFNY